MHRWQICYQYVQQQSCITMRRTHNCQFFAGTQIHSLSQFGWCLSVLCATIYGLSFSFSFFLAMRLYTFITTTPLAINKAVSASTLLKRLKLSDYSFLFTCIAARYCWFSPPTGAVCAIICFLHVRTSCLWLLCAAVLWNPFCFMNGRFLLEEVFYFKFFFFDNAYRH